jgi:hypothetical protein
MRTLSRQASPPAEPCARPAPPAPRPRPATRAAARLARRNTALNVSTSTSGSGYEYGGRLGYGLGPLLVGGEYAKGTLKLSGESTDQSEIYAVLGIRFPILVNLLFAYAVSNKQDGTNGDGGYKGTIQFRLLPLVNLNFEYFDLKYKGITPTPAGPSAGLTMKAEDKGFAGGISFPLEF